VPYATTATTATTGRTDDADQILRITGFRAHERAPQLVSVESNGPDCPHNQVETTSRVDAIVLWIHSTIHGN
jgi:hypothetical protein